MSRRIALALAVALLAPAEARAANASDSDAGALEDADTLQVDPRETDSRIPDGDTEDTGALPAASGPDASPDASGTDYAAPEMDSSPPPGISTSSWSAPPPMTFGPLPSSRPPGAVAAGPGLGGSLADGLGAAAGGGCGSDAPSDDGSDAPGACDGPDAAPDDCAMGRSTPHRGRGPFSRLVVVLAAGAAIARRKGRA
jgi:hypothetical protein